MPGTRTLHVLDAATAFAVAVGDLIEHTRPPLIDVAQLRSAVNSIGANIAEGYGRGPGPDRVRFFRIARGSAEEAIQHLRLNHRSGRIERATFFRLMNRGMVVVKMLDALIAREIGTAGAATRKGDA